MGKAEEYNCDAGVDFVDEYFFSSSHLSLASSFLFTSAIYSTSMPSLLPLHLSLHLECCASP